MIGCISNISFVDVVGWPGLTGIAADETSGTVYVTTGISHQGYDGIRSSGGRLSRSSLVGRK